ncbi:MAG: sigma-70 family RNA polymerase sigma factor [Planctomycetota bacterium]|jgi:RNA polymerase sigma factor (TIGR02999 family)
MASPKDVTLLLVHASDGDGRALDQLLPLVYDELRALAEGLMWRERQDHTLQPTALVHEAYLKLVDQTRVRWENRAHFFAVAGQAIRRILVDHARRHRRLKRGGEKTTLALDEGLVASYQRVVDLVALSEALDDLERHNPQQARIVEMRFFSGLSIEETATVLDVSTATVEREWRYARARLYRILSGDAGVGPTEQSGDG